MALFKCNDQNTVYSKYLGEYEVTPLFNEQKLNTKNKLLDKDVKVKEIYVGQTINEGGGYTAYVGEQNG